MDLALQLLFTGIGIGAVYALVALGFVLIFRATNVVNFAQGEFSMVAAYLMVVAVEAGLPYWAAFIVALLGMALVGATMDRFLAERHLQPYGNRFTVHGRARDALVMSDGQRVTTWQVDQCFNEARGMAHYELRQDETGVCALRFVPDGAGPTEENLRVVTSRLEALLKSSSAIKAGPMPVLLPAASGKFRLTCRVAADKVGA